MNLFEACFIFLLIQVFLLVLLTVAGVYGWLWGLGAACGAVAGLVGVVALLGR